MDQSRSLARKSGSPPLLWRRRNVSRGSASTTRLSLLAERVGISKEEAAEALDAVSPPRSLSETVSGEENGTSLESLLADDGETEKSFERIALGDAIGKMSEMRQRIVFLRYYKDLSQEETARRLGLSQVKVSREEKKILLFLKEALS